MGKLIAKLNRYLILGGRHRDTPGAVALARYFDGVIPCAYSGDYGSHRHGFRRFGDWISRHAKAPLLLVDLERRTTLATYPELVLAPWLIDGRRDEMLAYLLKLAQVLAPSSAWGAYALPRNPYRLRRTPMPDLASFDLVDVLCPRVYKSAGTTDEKIYLAVIHAMHDCDLVGRPHLPRLLWIDWPTYRDHRAAVVAALHDSAAGPLWGGKDEGYAVWLQVETENDIVYFHEALRAGAGQGDKRP